MCASCQVSLTREEFTQSTKMFDDLDRNHDGVIDLMEFEAAMESAGRRMNKMYTFDGIQRIFMEAQTASCKLIYYTQAPRPPSRP